MAFEGPRREDPEHRVTADEAEAVQVSAAGVSEPDRVVVYNSDMSSWLPERLSFYWPVRTTSVSLRRSRRSRHSRRHAGASTVRGGCAMGPEQLSADPAHLADDRNRDLGDASQNDPFGDV